ncbi:leucine--tRNA ligase [Patescibacteria group bacterium]|nr:leucine--tRNA ligase [Patescibacteria group bacterium]
MKYQPQRIERRWQRFWEKEGLHQAKDRSKKPKKYILAEFPYPSGEGLHVGHCRPYIALDVVSRKRRMEGFNVLFPMGWDAFGLPTENYAIRTGIHPRIVTRKNTAFFKHQQKSIGLSFDWSREIATTDPDYYKWTQWIFLQLFKKGLAYKTKMPINWCPSCKIGLANEEVLEGHCERCGKKVERKEKEQWMLKITKYAERLLEDLEKVDYPEKVKILQRDWIGRSCGVEIKFPLATSVRNRRETKNAKPRETFINVFTTRIDTIFGATYLVIAPEHPILDIIKPQIKNLKALETYIEKAKRKLERERISEVKEKTGVRLEGVKAVNPATKKEIPIFVADYVLIHYGTGAIMAVPCHDGRDLDFARAYNLPVIEVIKSHQEKKVLPKKAPLVVSDGRFAKAYEGEGTLIDSGRFNGLESEIARERILEWLGRKGLAKKAVHYKLRDWIFSRQRYWGEPIPMIKCEKCGWVPVSERDLPVKLPNVKEYKPTQTGESPLAKIESWLKTKCPKCQGEAKRETDVMPNWAGSNWYFLRYCDPKNDKKLASSKLLGYWMPVDWYNGGMEHVTLHLLYSRFIYKFLWDIKAVPKSCGPEPYKKRTAHGIVLGEGWVKMSKSRGNVITPERVIKQYGADTLRTYEMFMGPFTQAIAWDTKGVRGVRRFLQKVWGLFEKSKIQNPNVKSNPKPKTQNPKLKKVLHRTIKKVSEDIENMKFNTAVSALMEFSNAWQETPEGLSKKDFKDFLKILSPFAPHMTEELWQRLGNQRSIFLQKWPKYDEKLIKEEEITLIVQINGRVRDKIEVESGISESQAKKIALQSLKIKKWLLNKKIKKTIFVKDKLINFVI